MMKRILSELYNGNLAPAEQFVPSSQEYRTLRAQTADHGDAMLVELKRIDPALAKRFEQMMDKEVDAQIMELEEMFEQGFRMGARVMQEVYAE